MIGRVEDAIQSKIEVDIEDIAHDRNMLAEFPALAVRQGFGCDAPGPGSAAMRIKKFLGSRASL